MNETKIKFRELFRKWGLESIKLNIKFAELTFSPTDDDQVAAWEMYVELITRITTQLLPNDMGDEATALNSIYSLFETTRWILKTKGRNAPSFSRIAIVVLNQIIRPFTTKWHRKKISGAFLDQEECKNFRLELAELQVDLTKYAKMLADIAMVEDITDLENDTI